MSKCFFFLVVAGIGVRMRVHSVFKYELLDFHNFYSNEDKTQFNMTNESNFNFIAKL